MLNEMTLALRIYLAAFLTCLLREVAGVLHGATIKELDNLFDEYEITTPTLVTVDGDFLSHDLRRATPVASAPRHEDARRRKRSVSDEEETVVLAIGQRSFLTNYNSTIDVRNDTLYASGNESEYPAHYQLGAPPTDSRRPQASTAALVTAHFLHFNVTAFGKTMLLRVQLKERLVAPGAKTVIFTESGDRIEKDILPDCAFSGNIAQMPGSAVAINNCDGLAGLIKTSNEEFFIEPIEPHNGDPLTPQNHVVYRRSAPRASVNYGKRRSRTKRHDRRNAYNMEMLLTADSEIVQFHGSEHVEKYLLTLINIVDEIYHDDSLGRHINIILTRIYQLDEQRSTRLIVADEAVRSLKNVCKWADDLRRTEPAEHGRSHDIAVFLTRRSFGPAGYAHVTGMCHPLRSCSLNHEDGFGSAFVIAHETGHVLGMEHDGEGNRCGDETSMGSIMAPLVEAAFHRYHWSRCSQQELEANIESFHCLTDDPHRPNWGPNPVYPGVAYSVDDQCRFQFGDGYRKCEAFSVNVCKTLWCSHDDNPLFCRTKQGPPVDGTDCGEGMWCFKSHCIQKHQREAVDGSWGPWSTYGDCSRSCGTGVMFRTRECNRPPPSNGGHDCVGRNMDPDLCSRQTCPKGTDYRVDQCTYNNPVLFKQQKHKWLPYEHPRQDLKCELFCVSKKTNQVASMGTIVADGTRCSYEDPHGICIRGECVNVGCDKVIDSSLHQDACGVCGGDGTQCRNYTGKLIKRTTKRSNSYQRVYKIPQGARHIRIEEVPAEDNSNVLALKSRSEKRYFLNAKKNRLTSSDLPHRVVSSGALWRYDSTGDGVETITAHGPTNSVVILVILVKRRNLRTQLQYSYVLHVSDASGSYGYVVKKWTSCSVTCGTGYRKARYGCRSGRDGKWVSRRKCAGRPPRNTKKPCEMPCYTQTRWLEREWGPCLAPCDSNGLSYRNVTCVFSNSDGSFSNLSDSLCSGLEKPATTRQCSARPCGAWRMGSWSPCDRTCGKGLQRRKVVCRARSRSVVTENACPHPKPDKVQQCILPECEETETFSRRLRSVPAPIAGLIQYRNLSLLGVTRGVEECTEDKSIFCKLDAIASYCDIPGYRALCCNSCRERDGNQLSVAVHPPLSSAIALVFPNGTLNSRLTTGNETSTVLRQEEAIVRRPLTYLVYPTRTSPHSINTPDASDAEDYDDDGDDDDIPDPDPGSREEVQTLAPSLEVAAGTTAPPQHHRQEFPRLDTGARSVEYTLRHPRRRRHRRATQVVPAMRRSEKCKIDGECGVGIRHILYGCWNVNEKKWESQGDCGLPETSRTVCVAPCYRWTRLSSDKRGSQKRVFNTHTTCRKLTKEGLGPRMSGRRCGSSRIYDKIYGASASATTESGET